MRKKEYVTAVERIKELVEIRPDGTAVVVGNDCTRRPDCRYAVVVRNVTHAMPIDKFLELTPAVE